MKNVIIEVLQMKYVEFMSNEITIYFTDNLKESKQIKLFNVFAFVLKEDISKTKYLNIRYETSYCLDIKSRNNLDNNLSLIEILFFGVSSEDSIPFRIVASSYELL
jgi:hypothetical protein